MWKVEQWRICTTHDIWKWEIVNHSISYFDCIYCTCGFSPPLPPSPPHTPALPISLPTSCFYVKVAQSFTRVKIHLQLINNHQLRKFVLERENCAWRILFLEQQTKKEIFYFSIAGSRLWDCRVVSVESVTHNCKLFCCELPNGVIMRIPIGHHIHMSRDVEGLL